MSTPDELQETLARGCLAGGLDLVHPFAVAAYDHLADPADRLSDLGRADALAFLIGNTRDLWPALRGRVLAEPARRRTAHPLDDLVVETVTAAAAALGVRSAIRFGHVIAPRPLPLQRIAAAAGLAALSPCHLSVHPRYGPWLALRAVVVVDAPAPTPAPPATAPCAGCAAPCLAPFTAARGTGTVTARAVAERWRAWVAVRDACPVGRDQRYDEEQLAYHYAGVRPAWLAG